MITKRFSKLMILAVCIILVFAVSAALFFDSVFAPVQNDGIADSGEGADEIAAYPVTADGYTHGSNIGRSTSGTVYDVNNASDLATRISNNQNIRLTGPITLTTINTSSYSGTLYGNGQTITIKYTSNSTMDRYASQN